MILYFFTLFSIGCNDYTLEKNNVPELVVYPEVVNFGHLLSGQESGVETFAIINAGTDSLTITSPELNDNLKFSLDQDISDEYTILPGETLEFHVYYDPITFEEEEGTIVFSSNDADETNYELPVIGYGDAPIMTVSPEIFDYGQISIGCYNEERITIRNEGNLDLTISNITQMVTSPHDIIMEFGTLPSPPWHLSPNQEIDFLVSYVPTDINYDESIIRIEGNDPATPLIETTQFGEGDVEHWYTQTYVQEEIALLDVLFVVDNSGSMNIFQQELSNQMSSFMNVLESSGSDYHLAVITTDEARFKQYDGYAWIDTTHQSPVSWIQNVISSIGIRGSGMEKGIEMAKYALEGDAAPGKDYYRENATIVIIYVSDEPDHSQGGWQSYTNFFDTLKLSTDLVRQFAVIGDNPSGCTFSYIPFSRNIQFGAGYYDMTQRYNGSWYSICAIDWGQQMQSLANTVTTQRSFSISEIDPIESTIVVSVNGQITHEWVYDSFNNSVVFNERSIPETNQTITIEYAVWGC